MPKSWWSALSSTQRSSSCSPPPRQFIGQSLAPFHPAFALLHLSDKHRHASQLLYLKSACDKVHLQLLWNLLQRLRILGRMLRRVQSYAGSLLSMRIKGQCGHSQSPSIGLQQGCALNATLSGVFVSDLHHHSQATAAAAGV
jgi:hypothetical protein